MAPGVGGGGSSQPAPSPAHTSGGGGHRGVQRSISATSGNKPRRGSTGGDTATECLGGQREGGEGGQGGQGPAILVVFAGFYCKIVLPYFGCILTFTEHLQLVFAPQLPFGNLLSYYTYYSILTLISALWKLYLISFTKVPPFFF